MGVTGGEREVAVGTRVGTDPAVGVADGKGVVGVGVAAGTTVGADPAVGVAVGGDVVGTSVGRDPAVGVTVGGDVVGTTVGADPTVGVAGLGVGVGVSGACRTPSPVPGSDESPASQAAKNSTIRSNATGTLRPEQNRPTAPSCLPMPGFEPYSRPECSPSPIQFVSGRAAIFPNIGQVQWRIYHAHSTRNSCVVVP